MAAWRDPPEAQAWDETPYELVAAQFGWAARAAKVAELARRIVARSKADALDGV